MANEVDNSNEAPDEFPNDGNTRYRVHEGGRSGRETRRISDVLPVAKSIRLNPRASRRGGLAMKLAIPVISAMLVGCLIVSLYVRNQVFHMQLNCLKTEAANSAFTTAMFGRLVLAHRDSFVRENPDYLLNGELRAGDHWLVTHGFVEPEEWSRATGFDLDEYAPASVMERAGERTILSMLTHWVNAPGGGMEIAAVFILNANGTILASSLDDNFRFDVLALKSVPLPPYQAEAAGIRVTTDYVDDFHPEPLIRGVAHIMSTENPDEEIGRAVVVLRTQRHSREQSSFLFMSLILTALMGGFMALVCWLTARRVVGPMRKLAEDMQAMAEGDYTRQSGMAGTDEIGRLGKAFDSLSDRLRVAWANEKETSRLESDLAIARNIQNTLLPLQTPRVKGLDMYTSYKPAREIGGDYFDFLPVDSQHMGIAIADASGKSIPAALVMSTTRAILRFVAPGGVSAAETLTRVNAILSVDIPKGMFVTAYYVILDPMTDRMICSSAGHTPLLIARTDGSVELVNPGGIALGFDNGPIFERSIREQEVYLHKGDRVLMYTDGVVECVNPANEEYSDRRLREFLRRNRDLSSHDFVGVLLADLDRHRGAADMRDDTTIVTFKVL